MLDTLNLLCLCMMILLPMFSKTETYNCMSDLNLEASYFKKIKFFYVSQNVYPQIHYYLWNGSETRKSIFQLIIIVVVVLIIDPHRMIQEQKGNEQ